MSKPKHFELCVYDFDGVMTDNRAWISQEGIESVAVNRSDGLGVRLLKEAGYRQLILTTEKIPLASLRAEKMGIGCIMGSKNKAEDLKAYCTENGIDISKVAFIGNDINDIGAMAAVGTPLCPADAYPEVKRVAHNLNSNGGRGVIREFAQWVLGDAFVYVQPQT